MEILDKLPDELKWNVLKYLRHPVVDMFQNKYYVECVTCIRRFCTLSENWEPLTMDNFHFSMCENCVVRFCSRCGKRKEGKASDGSIHHITSRVMDYLMVPMVS